MAETGRTEIDVAACRVGLHRSGAGEPLLYLHGEDGAAPSLPLLRALAERFAVWLPEHPGFDGSQMPPWLETIHDLAYFYLDFLDAAGLARVHLAGHSLGGWIALEIAVRNPERLKSLTLIGSASIHVKGVPKGDLFMRAPDVVFRSMFADEALANRLLERTLTPAEQDAFLKNRYAVARVAWHPPLFDPQLEKWLHRARMPTHIVWGDTDRILPAAYGDAFARLIPGSRLTVIPACGHLPHLEQPQALATAVAAFIEEATP